MLRSTSWLTLIAVLVLVAASAAAARDPLQALWDAAEAARTAATPKTAAGLLEPLITRARAEGSLPWLFKALTTRALLQSGDQEDALKERVLALAKLPEGAPAELRPLLDSALAVAYLEWAQANRWRIGRRQATAGVDDQDFTTWDLARFAARADALFQAALAKRDWLAAQRVADWRCALDGGDAPETVSPTLLDVVAHQALSFYESDERGGPRPTDAFELDADGPVLEPLDRFLEWKPDTGDTSAPLLQAALIHQHLLRAHRGAGRADALLDAELNRLRFARAAAAGGAKDERYLQRLVELCERNAGSPVVTMAWWHRARLLQERRDLVAAMAAARAGAALHPTSTGALNCASVVAELLAKSVSLATERTQAPGTGTVRVTYRNLDRIHLRVYADRWDRFTNVRDVWNPDQLDDARLRALLKGKPLQQWTVQLQPTPDFKDRTVETPLPKLGPGFYRLVASWREDFAWDRDERTHPNALHGASLWISGIALVARGRAGRLEGLVVDTTSGEPVAGAEVSFYAQRNDLWRKLPLVATSDADGCFAGSGKFVPDGALIVAQRGEHRAMLSSSLSSYRPDVEPATERAVVFTDRALYRPGQEIKFKAVLHVVHHAKDAYAVLPGRNVVVRLRDRNYRPVAELKMTSNAFGSVAGSFEAPGSVLTGAMTLSVDGYSGAATVRVEEYKRPTFTVALEPPAEGGRLGERVTVKGTATAYTGAAMDGAKVRWRVTRAVRWPWWRCFYWAPPAGAPQEMAHGTATADAAGAFAIQFEARPDKAAAAAEEPSFTYAVSADVTDTAGETRTGQAVVTVGTVALEARLSVPEWLTADAPVRLGLSTATLDGKPAAAAGELRLYKLTGPDRPVPEPRERVAQLEDPSRWATWPDGAAVSTAAVATKGDGTGEHDLGVLAPGAYRARLTTKDRFGSTVTSCLPFLVLAPEAPRFPVRIPSYFKLRQASVPVGGRVEALWGTGYDEGRAFIELEQGNQLRQRAWTARGATQHRLLVPVTAAFKGGFTVHVTQVREGRLYTWSEYVDVPWLDKQLTVTVGTLRSPLTPGQKETVTLTVKGKDAPFRAAELAAALYDASLDAFAPHGWSTLQGVFRRDSSSANVDGVFADQAFNQFLEDWNEGLGTSKWTYWSLPGELGGGGYGSSGGRRWSLAGNGYGYGRGGPVSRSRAKSLYRDDDSDESDSLAMADDAPPESRSKGQPEPESEKKAKSPMKAESGLTSATSTEGGAAALDQVQARKDLGETAIWAPQLALDEAGAATITFTAPEALTAWKLLTLAHGAGLESGLATATTVTRKDLMVRPTAPRFLREGDELSFSAKVVNQAATAQAGSVRLTFRDALTDKVLDGALGLATTDQAFTVPAGQSRPFFWKLKVPVGLPPLAFKVVASSGALSDGEEGLLPVLSGRVLVTESLPLPIRGAGTKSFRFEKLLASAASTTIAHQGLTVQVVSNPAWYAVQALPYLQEYPHECSEQVWNRLYSNALASHVARSDPKIRAVFDRWKGTAALASNLEKNEQLKGALLQETPWVLEAQGEELAKRRVGLLFDAKRLERELASATRKLKDMRLPSGAYPWFPGGQQSEFITLYVLAGAGRLRHLEVSVELPELDRSLSWADAWVRAQHEWILKHATPSENHLSHAVVLYLYGRTFFTPAKPVSAASTKAFEYFMGQGRKYWTALDLMSQGQLALAMARRGDTETPAKIVKSLRERAINSEELGMHWAAAAQGWWWYQAPIETQAVMIEVFQEVAKDEQAVDGCQVWLLKQKQTQSWPTTKATADAVYALLLRGRNLLASSELLQVSLDGQVVQPATAEAGTGAYEKRFAAADVRPAMGAVTLTKKDAGVAWGSLHWQYFEDLDKVTPHQTPLGLTKTLFLERATDRGPVIEPLKDQVLRPGDRLKVRIVLKADRAMEFLHLKDGRGSGTEPVNVLSRYRSQDGLWYYEATGDTATNFFIDSLPVGTYVFEYPLQVVHKGRYQSGMASIQCMYAPEFNSHSGSVALTVAGE